jgi:hypothetical protein
MLIDDLDTMLDGPLTLGQVYGNCGNDGKEHLKMEI